MGWALCFPVLYLESEFAEYGCKSASTLRRETCGVTMAMYSPTKEVHIYFFNIYKNKSYVMYAYNSYN